MGFLPRFDPIGQYQMRTNRTTLASPPAAAMLRAVTTKAAVATLLAAVAAGCGSGDGGRLSHREYEQRVTNAIRRLNARIVALRPEAAALGKLSTSLRATADELDRVRPPGDAAGANDDLVEGLRSFAAEIEDERDVVASGRGLEVREALSRIARARGVREIQRAEA